MRWQQTLQDALNYKNTIILCGNVRDKYLYLEPHTDDAYRLLNLKEYLIEFLGRQVNILRFYDPIRKKTEYSQTAAPSQKRAAASNDPFAGTEPESDEDEWGRESKIEADLERIREEATSEEQLWWVLQYADKITPEKSNSAEERKLILRIEKLIENLPAQNKLFMVYLFPEQIPREFYLNHPKSKVIELQAPDRRELHTLFAKYYKRNEEEVERAVNVSDGLKFLEIEQVVDSLPDGFDIKLFEERVRTYKFGKSINYWEEISLKRLDAARDFFIKEEGVSGQDHAIEEVIKVVMRAKADIQRKTGGNPRSPCGVLFFFADPTGVGKTLTAKTLAKFLFGSEDALQRFDMSEYRHDFQVTRLYGAPPGYVGYESGGALTNAVKARPFTVLPRMTIFRITLLTISREAEGELFSFSTFLCSGVLKRSFSSGEAFSEPGTGPAPDACRLGLPDASPANTR